MFARPAATSVIAWSMIWIANSGLVPKDAAQALADRMAAAGVRSIWNFAPVDVAVRRGVAVENVHLSDSLYVLSYKKANV